MAALSLVLLFAAASGCAVVGRAMAETYLALDALDEWTTPGDRSEYVAECVNCSDRVKRAIAIENVIPGMTVKQARMAWLDKYGPPVDRRRTVTEYGSVTAYIFGLDGPEAVFWVQGGEVVAASG